jgi:hypothetical protein
MGDVITHGDVAFGLGSKAAFTFGKNTKDSTTSVKIKNEGASEIARWGDDNQFPQNYLKELRKNGTALSALRVLKATHYGQGFHLYLPEINENGKNDKRLVSLLDYPEINTFFNSNKINRFWTETIADEETFYIAFPEFILSKDFNKIVSLRRQPAPKIRFEQMNEKTGLIEHCYMSHNWTTNTNLKDDYVAKIPVIDSYWSADQIKEYCRKKKIYKFVMPVFYPFMDETYYPCADHHAVYHNGWMQVANSIPEYKQKLFENQIHIKYMVHISEEYFKRTYQGDWENFKPEERLKIRKKLTEAIDEHLSGNKNAGKSIQSVTYKDHLGNWVKGIEVQAIDDKLKDGAYLPEATAANSEISYAFGVDPSIVGAGIPGGKMNTGSGSDKREAFSILTSLFKTKRETTLDIWRLLRDYNGWDPRLEGGFANTSLTTLDANPTGTETVM